MGWNSSRAVDGNPDQDGTYGSCAWAHNNDDVFKTWWNVDLGSTYNIKTIEVFFRTDGMLLLPLFLPSVLSIYLFLFYLLTLFVGSVKMQL
jgi:hypothetical protein